MPSSPPVINVYVCRLHWGPLDGEFRPCVIDRRGDQLTTVVHTCGRSVEYVGSQPQDERVPHLAFAGYITEP